MIKNTRDNRVVDNITLNNKIIDVLNYNLNKLYTMKLKNLQNIY